MNLQQRGWADPGYSPDDEWPDVARKLPNGERQNWILDRITKPSDWVGTTAGNTQVTKL